ncbi:MAG TPA: hypothetical protein VLW85_14710 [Myxococcales bacterium]|nr:hypothetical protein [Myxococcales bacterium]
MRSRQFVESWLVRRTRTGVADELATEALEAVWQRAQRSLSELALAALGRCALEAAARHSPALAEVRVGPRGFELPAAALPLPALGGLLAELLALIEETSGEILTPALEAELLRVGGGRRTPPHGQRPYASG